MNMILYIFTFLTVITVTQCANQYTYVKRAEIQLSDDVSIFSYLPTWNYPNGAFSYEIQFLTSSSKNIKAYLSNYRNYDCSNDYLLFFNGNQSMYHTNPCTEDAIDAAIASTCGTGNVTWVSDTNVAYIQICTGSGTQTRTLPTFYLQGTTSSGFMGSCGQSYVPNPWIVNGQITIATNPQISGDIVGGITATRNQYPYQAIFLNDGGFCGGSLLNTEWIVTAAHCFTNIYLSKMTVYLGMYDIDNFNNNPDAIKCAVKKAYLHGSYNNRTNENDIAIVNFYNCNKQVTYNQAIQPICLPESSDDLRDKTGTDVIISGWGTTKSNGYQPQYLKAAVTQIYDHTKCVQTYARSGATGNGWLCAASAGVDTCQGDSGGPLVYYQDGHYILYGITSFGYGCATPGYAGVYTNVPSYIAWIRTNMA